MSLRTRLVLAAAYLLVVVVLVLEVPLARTLKRRVEQDFANSIVTLSSIVASQINDDIGCIDQAAITPSEPCTLEDPWSFISDTIAAADGDSEVPIRMVVVDLAGRAVADSDGIADRGELYATPERPEFGRVLGSEGTTTIDVNTRYSDDLGQELLVVTAPIFHDRDVAGAVRVSAETGTIDQQVKRAWIGLALIGLGVIAVGLTLAYFLASSLARPVERLQAVALDLGGGDLEARATPEGPKEIASLARSFNDMADELSSNIEAQRDFVANASHQLRTPLTGLRLRLEAIEGDGGPAAEQAQKAGAEVDRLERLVDDLLALARATAGAGKAGARVDLAAIATGAVDRWAAPAGAAGHQLDLVVEGTPLIWADPADAQHLVDNLIENALRYTPEGTHITVRAASDGSRPMLSVADDGPGIAPEDRERVFERFYRGASGRRAGPGTGLGLAIVAEIVHRWGGEVRLGDEALGMCVEARFPAAPGSTARAGAGSAGRDGAVEEGVPASGRGRRSEQGTDASKRRRGRKADQEPGSPEARDAEPTVDPTAPAER
jgi:signal transduction histidine kinase